MYIQANFVTIRKCREATPQLFTIHCSLFIIHLKNGTRGCHFLLFLGFEYGVFLVGSFINYIHVAAVGVLEHEEGAIYKYFKVEGYNFDAHMAVIYDPSKISVVHTKYLWQEGQYLVDMARENNAVVAINGGAFVDINGLSNGGAPEGILIKNGEIIQASRNRTHGGGVIGFTNDNKLYLGDVSASEAVANGVRDAVEFGPFLVVNGKPSFIQGNGGYGIHPRTAIGQRKDGVVLFLVVDGRRMDSMGTDMKNLCDIMVKYGAYNAANLDGGNSSVLVINNKIVNRPINWDNMEQTRPIADGFIVTE
mgnify:CR=1 FL=1